MPRTSPFCWEQSPGVVLSAQVPPVCPASHTHAVECAPRGALHLAEATMTSWAPSAPGLYPLGLPRFQGQSLLSLGPESLGLLGFLHSFFWQVIWWLLAPATHLLQEMFPESLPAQ